MRYIEHTSYTRSNNLQVAYEVHTLNCHEYDPVDEIMGLAKAVTDCMPQIISTYSYTNTLLKQANLQ